MKLKLPEALPSINGWGLVAYRLVWCALFALSLIQLVWFDYAFEKQAQRAVAALYSVGLRDLGTDGAGERVAPSSDEARHAGVVNGALLLAIDGQPLALGNDYLRSSVTLEKRLMAADGKTFTLTLLLDDGSRRDIVLTKRESRLRDAYAGSGLTFALQRAMVYWIGMASSALILMVAALLFVRRPRDPVAALFSLGLVLNLFVPSMIFSALPVLISSLVGASGFLLTILALSAFPNGRFEPRWVWTGAPFSLLYLVSAVSVGGALTGIALLNLSFALLTIGIPLAALFVRYRQSTATVVRQQIKFVALGFFGTASCVALATGINSIAEHVADLSEGTRAWCALATAALFALQGILIAVGLLIALLRFRLYDADAVITRSAAFAFLTLLLGAAFAGTEKVIEVLGEEFFGESSHAMAAGLGAAVAAAMVAPLHSRIHHWAEHRFQKALAHLRRTLPAMVADMREFATLDDLLPAVVAALDKSMLPSRVAVLVAEDGHALRPVLRRHIDDSDVSAWLDRWRHGDRQLVELDRDDPLFPVRLRLRAEGMPTVGWLLLGPRPDGSVHGKDQRNALEALADPLARAIHIVRRRDARDAWLLGRLRAVEAELSQLLRTAATPSS